MHRLHVWWCPDAEDVFAGKRLRRLTVGLHEGIWTSLGLDEQRVDVLITMIAWVCA